MWQLPWLVMVIIALTATIAWGVLDRRPVVMTAIGGGTWSLLAYASATIKTHTETGAVVTYEALFVQYLFAFLAAISFLALWAVVWWDNLPSARYTPSKSDNTEA